MKDSWKRIGILIFLVVFLFDSCSKPKINIASPLTTKLSSYNTVLVNVTTILPDTSEQVSSLETKLVKQLLKKGFFEKVVPSSFDPEYSTDLRIDVKIKELRKAGILSAFVFAGAKVVAEVSFIDRKKGDTLGRFETAYSRSRMMTGEVLGGIAQKIVQYIEDNR